MMSSGVDHPPPVSRECHSATEYRSRLTRIKAHHRHAGSFGVLIVTIRGDLR